MGRTKNQNVWRNFTDKSKLIECNFCKKSYQSKNVNKLQGHLLTCLHCPDIVKSRLRSKESKEQHAQPFDNPNMEVDDSSSSTATTSRSSSRASTPQPNSRPQTPNISNPPTHSSTLKPMAMFYDRMGDQENVRINFLQFFS